MIPIQATAKARRQFKMRGRGLARQGRPRLSEKRQSVAGGDGGSVRHEDGEGLAGSGVEVEGSVRHKLPSKKRKIGVSHSLSEAVASNKRSAKKH